jgi:hypothetical protein
MKGRKEGRERGTRGGGREKKKGRKRRKENMTIPNAANAKETDHYSL